MNISGGGGAPPLPLPGRGRGQRGEDRRGPAKEGGTMSVSIPPPGSSVVAVGSTTGKEGKDEEEAFSPLHVETGQGNCVARGAVILFLGARSATLRRTLT